jgi:hypothetical protein
MAFVLDPGTKDLIDPIPEQDMIEIRDYTFANILNYAKKLDREGRSRAAGGVAEEAPAEKVTTTSAVVRSSKKTPAFALACRRQVWQPVSQTRASVLHDIVHEQWQAFLTDPGISLFVNTIDAEQGYNCGLQWWKENQVKYSYVWQYAERVLCIVASSAPSERVFSCAGNVVTNKRCRLTSETVNILVTLSQNAESIDWELETKKRIKC